ncbi:MAG: hypothetical protein QOH98_1149 [Methylobacteriaceae bacterium]|jgi:hypothetical protein|nr:hypothetical protein [Methylobacteriaceae bacterium]
MTLRRFSFFTFAALASAMSAAAEPAENWQTAFPRDAAAEQSVYFGARYVDASGVEHRQEVWREASNRLRRVTDDRLDLIVERDADGEYQYRLADRERHIMVLADRTSLYRAGIFSDWEGLAYALSRPRAEHELIAQRASEQTAAGSCSWTTLIVKTPAESASRICWSSEWGLPLSIQTRRGDEWVMQFAITEVRAFQPSDTVFQVDPAGYLEMDTRAGDDLAD